MAKSKLEAEATSGRMLDSSLIPNVDTYDTLVKSRQYLRAKVTRIHGKVLFSLSDLALHKKRDFFNQLKHLSNELFSINVKTSLVWPEGTDEDAELEKEEEYQDLITVALEILKPFMEVGVPPPQLDPPIIIPPQNATVLNKLRLPDIELPVFSNDRNDNLEKFFFGFESIVDKHNLSNYEKFVYLRGQVRKGPEALLNSLDPNDQTYAKAKELLTDAFASPLTQKYDAIKKLSELKLNVGDDVYKFIGNMKSIRSSFNNLQISVSEVIQFFLWSSMNKKFQDQMIQITNVTKPSLTQIDDNIFSTAERYLKLDFKDDNYTSKRNSYKFTPNASCPEIPVTNGLAINIDRGKTSRPCNLCVADKVKSVEHVMRNCPVYITANDKVKKLQSLNFCSKCSFANHNSSNCKFKFHSPCRFCRKPHMSFLCLVPKVENLSVSCIYFNSVIRDYSALLPTFSLLVNPGIIATNCRVLYDTGSQCNFIRGDLVDRMKLESVEENVHLKIKGFNYWKMILTNIVRVPVKIKDHVCNINAVVVPEIDIKLFCSNIPKITKTFKNKGYVLADHGLGDSGEVSGFGLVMGPDAARLLRPQTVAIGRGPDCSVYKNTEIGVLLLGETREICKDLCYLPNLYNENVESHVNGSLYNNNYSDKDADCTNHKSIDIHTSTVNQVLTETGEVDRRKLNEATNEALEACTNAFFNLDMAESADCTDMNQEIVNYVLSNTDRTPEGRLIMPLPWNPNCKHLLGKNFNLSRKILQSNFHKLKKEDRLTMYDNVFKEQEGLGIIERIDDIDTFMAAHPDCSFLPHMGVVRMAKETTKLRIVMLSNLCEKNKINPNAVSHNNALLPGPCMNTKLSISLFMSRFEKYVLAFDITKAFLGIELLEEDQNKLLCLWYKSVEKGDYSLIAYRNLRLSFGLRPSPAILMMALYKICIIDTENDTDEVVSLKKQIYSNIYMDNGLVGCNDVLTLESYFRLLPLIFEEYKFALQQFTTNCIELQNKIDVKFDSKTEESLKYFGMNWNRVLDTLGPFPIDFDSKASTKRTILSSLNSVYDLFGLCLPLVNRAKLFFHKLQCNYKLDWDAKLNDDILREWKLICRQSNNLPSLQIDRFVGARDSEYSLVAFSDSSAAIYGTVVYIIENSTRKVSFMLAKNKVVNTKLSAKSIPSLECQGVVLAAETLIDLYTEFCTSRTLCPINITNLCVYTDSMVCLSWIKSYFILHDKMQKRSVYVMNRLKQLGDICDTKPITFRFIEGRENPSDCVTRPLSYKSLMQTSYITGPEFLQNIPEQPEFEVVVPNPVCSLNHAAATGENIALEGEGVQTTAATAGNVDSLIPLTLGKHLVDPDLISSFRKMLKAYTTVFKFINILKCKLAARKGLGVPPGVDHRSIATNVLLRSEQNLYFPEIVQYFKNLKFCSVPIKDIPNLVLQLNLYVDENFIIRVKGKFNDFKHPILLSHKSRVSYLVISDMHHTFAHSGVYTVLRELRRQFWILRGFSTVRKLLRDCVTCKKLNSNPVKLSQNCYREFRASPSQTPFRDIFLDYIGPVNVRFEGKVRKTWLLIVTCMYTRAVSLQIAFSADTTEFLRVLQMHVYTYGMFQFCVSDLGTQLKAGANIICKFLTDPDSLEYFKSNGINKLHFEQYAKGNSSLGSLVEILVKHTKSLIIKSIGKLILPYCDFQLLICKVNHIINRRPISFREGLRESLSAVLPEPITAEHLLHGRELPSVNLIPTLQPDFEPTEDQSSGSLRDDHSRLRQVLIKLNELYHDEFLSQLMYQSCDKRDRYKPVYHKTVSPGDVVLLVEPQTKRSNYPLAIVKEVEINSLGEVTSARVMKGKNREIVLRHASTIIPLLSYSGEDTSGDEPDPCDQTLISDPISSRPPKRQAALGVRERVARQLNS